MPDVRLKLSPPWITYVNKIKALFENDPEIKIEYDNDLLMVKLFVEDTKKACAIATLLPEEKEFADLPLEICIIPANLEQFDEIEDDFYDLSHKELFDLAFKNNPVYAFSYEINDFFGCSITYVVFKNRVVQFFNDNLNDIHGLISTLYQDIADEIFEDAGLFGVFYCTDIEEKVGKPLGEWP